MLAQWSVECGADDPVLVVPWSDAQSGARFVDLRENPYDLDHIPEAEQHPALLHALRALNAGRSSVLTAKCDAWVQTEEEREALQVELDVAATEAPAGFSSYIDLVVRERAIFVSFHQQEQRLMRLTRLLEPLDHPYAVAECVLRPAVVDLASVQEGFSMSLYVKALGTDAAHAYEHWAAAVDAVVGVVRGREFSA